MADSIKKGVPMIQVPDVARTLDWYASIGFNEIARYEDNGLVNFGIDDVFYGARQFGIRDPNGYILYFISHSQRAGS